MYQEEHLATARASTTQTAAHRFREQNRRATIRLTQGNQLGFDQGRSPTGQGQGEQRKSGRPIIHTYATGTHKVPGLLPLAAVVPEGNEDHRFPKWDISSNG
jgi:hypothetical protein